jgi:PIN domain nuclease of toxin-antitoxin system
VIVLDASCLVALFRGEPGQHDVVAALTSECSMNVVNRAEVIDRLARHGARADVISADLDTIGVEFIPLTIDVADAAAGLRSRHYHRANCPVSMADCVALATALAGGASLATSDVHLAKMSVAVGCQVTEIANSAGRYPLRDT